MSHPVFIDPPSKDMTMPMARQRELDAQIAAFLADGGEIHTMDNKPRELISEPWRSKSLTAARQMPAKTKRNKATVVAKEYEQIAVKIIVEAALGTPARTIARRLQIPLARLRAIALQCNVALKG